MDVLDLAREAARQGQFDSAYHLLMAVLHLADHSGSAELVEEVRGLARYCKDAVDAARPEHHLSADAAARRGQASLFDSLDVHARAVHARHRVTAGRG